MKNMELCLKQSVHEVSEVGRPSQLPSIEAGLSPEISIVTLDSAKFKALGQFDTEFLVDDSRSMEGPRWQIAEQIVVGSVNLISKRNLDGMGLNFFNKYHDDLGFVRSGKIAARAFENHRLSVSTPLKYILETILHRYIRTWFKQGAHRSRHFKRLNLIILTDGEPDEKP